MPHQRFSGQEIGERGSAIYEQSLRAVLETSENNGKLVSIDIETEEYELGTDGNFEAARKLIAKHPDAAVFTLRIGYNAVYALGGVVERVAA